MPLLKDSNFEAHFKTFFLFRSSHRRYSLKKSALRNFTKFTGKHLCQSLYFDKNTSGLPPLELDLQSNFLVLQKWFYGNHTINPGKYHYMLLRGHAPIDYISVNGIEMVLKAMEAKHF